MIFDVLTLFPEIIQSYCDVSIMKRAKEGGVFSVNAVNPRDFTLDKHKKVDDTPYGGGAGMVLAPQPYVDAYDSIEKLETLEYITHDEDNKNEEYYQMDSELLIMILQHLEAAGKCTVSFIYFI